MKNQTKAYLLALTAVLFWSTIGTAFKVSLRYLDPLSLLFFSSFTASFVLALFILITNNLQQLRRTTIKDLGVSAFLGLLNPFLYYVVLLKAYDRLPAQEAGTLNYIWPLVLVLLSIPLLKQKISTMSILAILISFSGIIVISTHGNVFGLTFSDPAGVLMAVGSAVFWALYWIFSLKDKRDAVVKLFLAFAFGWFYTLITLLWAGGIKIPEIRGLGGAIYIGIFEMGLTFLIWLNALKLSATTAKISNLIYLSPFISLIIIHVVIGEIILLSTIVGLLLIVSGIILQQYLKS